MDKAIDSKLWEVEVALIKFFLSAISLNNALNGTSHITYELSEFQESIWENKQN